MLRGKAPTAPSPSQTAATVSGTTGEPSPDPRVLVNDYELLARARRAVRDLDFSTVFDLDAHRWKPRRALDNGCVTYIRSSSGQPTDSTGSRCPWVLSTGQVHASAEEVARVLSSASDGELNAAMHALYPKDYIHGSVVRVVPVTTPAATNDSARLVVKTGTFVRSSIWNANEQWCYVELTASHTDSEHPDRFTVTQASMPASELTAGKVPAHHRVHELRGLLAGYLIEPSTTARHVRVVFLGHADYGGSGGSSPNADERSQRQQDQRAWVEHERLVRLAEGVSRLQELVLRRRLGVQVLADRQAFPAVNSRCICCTRRLLHLPRIPIARLLSSKRQGSSRSASEPRRPGPRWLSAKRCYLCGHNVCDRCWVLHTIEARVGSVSRLRVCSRCLEFVRSGDYISADPGSLGAPQVQRDLHIDSTGEPVDACRDASLELARMLLERLRDASSDAQRRQAVLTVVRHLVNDVPSRREALRAESGEREHVAVLKVLSPRLVPSIPLHECELAGAGNGRPYPIRMPVLAVMTPEGPMPPPEREQRRLEAVERGELDRVEAEEGGARGGAKGEGELDVLCALAAREMKCSTSVLSVVGQRHSTVIGSNVPQLRRLVLPRDQSFCQHVVMTDSPLLVPHPEADIRFQNIAARAQGGFRFYCGFPLRVALGGSASDAAEPVTVGTLCCLNEQSRELTQAQYSVMAKLVRAAARIIESKRRDASGAARTAA